MRFPRPLDDRVVVVQLRPEGLDEAGAVRTESGMLYKPATAAEDEPVGVVVAVGPAVATTQRTSNDPYGPPDPRPLVPGTQVLFHRHGGTEIQMDGISYRIFKESEIVARVDEADAHVLSVLREHGFVAPGRCDAYETFRLAMTDATGTRRCVLVEGHEGRHVPADLPPNTWPYTTAEEAEEALRLRERGDDEPATEEAP